jgi:predicted nucleic acid-binding protein
VSNKTAIVSDTGPLITLEKLSDGYNFISKIYNQILVPTIVTQELYRGEFLSWNDYKQNYGINDLIVVIDPTSDEILTVVKLLDEGEKQAIELAYEQNLPLLIEEEKGRNLAQSLGLQISGIAGQILKAHRQQIIEAVEAKQKLQELLQAGRIGNKMYTRLIAEIQKPQY